MKSKLFPFSFRSVLYGVFALYMLGVAVCLDSFAHQHHKKAGKASCCKASKKKCCGDHCPTKPDTCPPSCPCETPNAPSQVVLKREEIVAFSLQREAKNSTLSLSSPAPILPTAGETANPLLPLPAPLSGKELLRRVCVWRV